MSADATGARARSDLAIRLGIAGRVLVAIFGSYAIAALSDALLALILPISRAEAVSTATLVSFAVMAAAAIWVFAARTLGRAVLILGLIASALVAALWFAGAWQTGGVA